MVGTLSFQVQSKLNALKKHLKASFHRSPIKACMDAAEIDLHHTQPDLHAHPGDPHYASLEVEAAAHFKKAKDKYFMHVQQLSKIQWTKILKCFIIVSNREELITVLMCFMWMGLLLVTRL